MIQNTIFALISRFLGRTSSYLIRQAYGDTNLFIEQAYGDTNLFTKDGLYQVLVNNTILYTILDKNMQNYTIRYTNTIPNQNNQ
jgi:hypothetical protein